MLSSTGLMTTGMLFALPVLAIPAMLAGLAVPRPAGVGLLVSLVIAALLVGLGAAVLWSDRVAHELAAAAAWVVTKFARSRRAAPLARRLVTERDRIREAFAGHWVPALSAAAGNRMFDVAALVASLLAVGADANPFLVLLAYVVSLALALVPITPGGLGFVEAGLTSLLVLAGASAQEAVVATLLYRLASFWLPIPLGLLAWGGWRARRRTAGSDGRRDHDAAAAVATDLDGTIVPHDGEVSDRTVAALQAVEALGVPVVFVTGRPVRWMAEVATRTGHTGLAICANGAVLYDLHTEQIVEHHTIPVDVGLEVARRLRAAVPGSAFAVETLDGFSYEPTTCRTGTPGNQRAIAPLETIYDGPAVKLLARHEVLDPDAFLAAARRGGRRPGRAHPLLDDRAAGDLGGGGVEGQRAGPVRGPARCRRGRRGGVRRHAQRPGDAGLGRPPVRRGQRAPRGARRGDRPGAAAGAGRRRPRAGAPLRPLTPPVPTTPMSGALLQLCRAEACRNAPLEQGPGWAG